MSYLAPRFFAAVLATALPVAVASAQLPRSLSFQGYLTSEAGRPIDEGVYEVAFGIHCSADPADAAVCATTRDGMTSFDGMTALWEGTIADVRPRGGLFTVVLGEGDGPLNPPIPLWVLDGADRWVQVSIDGRALLPRQRLTSVPFAMRSAGSLVIVKASATGQPVNDNGGNCDPNSSNNLLELDVVDVEIPVGTVSFEPAGATAAPFAFTAPFTGWYRLTSSVELTERDYEFGETGRLIAVRAPGGNLGNLNREAQLDMYEVPGDGSMDLGGPVTIGLIVDYSGTSLIRLEAGDKALLQLCTNGLGGISVAEANLLIELAHLDQ